jgi:hypothetical protein
MLSDFYQESTLAISGCIGHIQLLQGLLKLQFLLMVLYEFESDSPLPLDDSWHSLSKHIWGVTHLSFSSLI